MTPQDALRQYFGFDSFRPPQDKVVASILGGHDTLIIMPTGGGKSLCYQLPALLLPGVTLVVSPLIALMKDQVDALQRKGIPAAAINSSQSWNEQRQHLDALRQGALRLVYIAPERFRAPSFLDALRGLPIALFAIDEAHCLSQWGHDFRPDYLRLGQALALLNHPPCAALTATATPEVRNDILHHLQLREPHTYVSGFARPNLSFRITQIEKKDHKHQRLLNLIQAHRTGIIYCATRKSVEKLSTQLLSQRQPHITYHGGMDDTARAQAQEQFMSGTTPLAIATNAFGMGIDRPDIRFVCHYEMPGSVEAYYQEGGRAGRDGLPATCEMLFCYADKRIQEFFIEGANPDKALITQAFAKLRQLADSSHEVQISIDDLTESLGKKINPMAVGTALSILARQYLIERFDLPGKRIRGTRLLQPDLPPHALPLDEAALQLKAQRDYDKLQRLIQFAYANECRQLWILRYFGETQGEPCGHCDHCQRHAPQHRRLPQPEELLLLKKILSGVARMSERLDTDHWRPRYGKQRILQTLLGSHAHSIREANLHQLSTWGLLKNESKPFIATLLGELEHQGLLETTTSEGYPLLTLTAYGSRVMRGTEIPHLCWPERAQAPVPAPAASTPAHTLDPKLYGQLAAKRLQLARARGGVPAYTILTNQVLNDLATLRPTTAEAALAIKGIGPAKAKKILPAFLRLIAAHTQDGGATDEAVPLKASPPHPHRAPRRRRAPAEKRRAGPEASA